MSPEKIARALSRPGHRQVQPRRNHWQVRMKAPPASLDEAVRRRIRIDRPHTSLELVRVFRSQSPLLWGNANWSSMTELAAWTPRLPARFNCARCWFYAPAFCTPVRTRDFCAEGL